MIDTAVRSEKVDAKRVLLEGDLGLENGRYGSGGSSS
jgi:hypothetical protein